MISNYKYKDNYKENCECYSNIPEIQNDICINCGKMFNIAVIFEQETWKIKDLVIPETKDYCFIVSFISDNLTTDKYNQEIIDMYTICVNKYKSLNNLSKIKEKASFAYLSCWYILKFYSEWQLCNQLIIYKNQIKNSNLNKANKIFYILTCNQLKIYSEIILYENYIYFIFKLLKDNNYLHLFDKISTLFLVDFENDKFNSKKNISDYILSKIIICS